MLAGARRVLRVRYGALALACVAIGAATAIPGAQARAARRAPSGRAATPPPAFDVGPLAPAERAWITRTIAHMTLPVEVGQLFEINGYGDSVDDTSSSMEALNQQFYGVNTMAQLIRRYHPGGIIYFDWSNGLTSPSQVGALSTGVQQTALSEGARLPMVISTDQEYGEVLRIGSPATVFPGNMALGADGSLADAFRAGRIGGVELRAMGINVDNAPVIDVNQDPLNETDGIRAYGDQPRFVSAFGTAQTLGYQADQASTGVGATAKHWPGFGDAPTDSDTGIAVSDQTLSQVQAENFPSFKAAIRAGIDRIMVTHILFPKITGSTIPSSLSPFWVDGQLRGQLGYEGPVVTDALDATALDAFTPAQVALKAIAAGDDELLEVAQTPTDTPPADLVTAYPAILNAVKDGTITKARLDESVARILALKWKLGLIRHPLPDTGQISQVVGTPAHLAVAQNIANRSITLLRNSAGLLPLHPSPGEKVLVTGFGQTTTATLGSDLAARGLTPTVLDTGYTPTADQIAQAVSDAQASQLVVVTTFNAWENPTEITEVNDLVATGTPVVVAAVGTPYDVAYLPTAQTFLAGYGYQPDTLSALVDVMFGSLAPTGRLPVTITDPPPSTAVLYPFGFGLSLLASPSSDAATASRSTGPATRAHRRAASARRW